MAHLDQAGHHIELEAGQVQDVGTNAADTISPLHNDVLLSDETARLQSLHHVCLGWISPVAHPDI